MQHLQPDDPNIKRDILSLIMQYLQEEGYTTSSLTLQDETNVKLAEQQTQRTLFKRMRKAILDGDWVEVDKLCSKTTFQQQKSFQYAAYREQFIELIEAQEYQKAFTHLTKRLKPLESSAASLSDFKDLCYLLTCRSVHEVLPNWQGAAAAREALLTHFATMLELEERRQETVDGTSLPAHRLVTLLEQAAAYQIVTSGYDKSVRLLDAAVGVEQRQLVGHELPAREAVFNATGNLVVSGGKDATIRFWDVRSALCVRKLAHSLGEVTSVRLSDCGTQLLTSSKDNSVRLWDVRAARPLRAFKGHQNTAKNFVRARFGPTRDLVLSGSEDGSVCLWSLSSGKMAHRLCGHTAVSYDAAWCGSEALLASCSHDGTVRTWQHDPDLPLSPDGQIGLW